jgi:hypothetical protein
MIDANDDLATARKPFRVVACIPVLGRGPLLKQTITRLYVKNGVDKVICAGHLPEDRKVCEGSGAVWVQAPNKPLGRKWNMAFQEAKKYNPDACLYVGSSDWLSDNWIPIMRPHVEKHHFTGTPGCYFLDMNGTYRLCHWKGYAGYRQDRADETIGIGRLLSADLLERINWKPFIDQYDNSLDRSMKERAASVKIIDHMVRDERLKSLSISTNQWVNKHFFNHHWTNILPSEKISNVKEFLDQNFPEAWLVFSKDMSVSQ